jgi:hypothetical protein
MNVLRLMPVLLLLSHSIIDAGVVNALKKGTVFSAKKYPINTDIAFELLNSTKFPINVIVSNATYPDEIDDNFKSKKMKTIEPNERYSAPDTQIDPTKTIFVRIYEDKTTGEPSLVYRLFAPGKTKYLSFELVGNRESLYPQVGSKALAVVRGEKTDTGFILKNNISQNDIQYISEHAYEKHIKKMERKGRADR